ncbi:Cytochrome P450 107B1 [Streptomyces ambofaciens ATCC 23877]|uniref:Cytochrome P450 107B1 n=1 Tax=Streptomyces ambofaciens (strain ATCC 23877 / 3486 / DSM 40053 / JCM 4204 / NBRC 12836 / NRRL B-2516) TaxID=278992 RepID=A0A0K2AV88_STRA7|nr:cytochrome P450 [Streptomyces ambofaciens]AKZ56934.1 Cytochrome P450 107B1 [Streptomyces ambofaciens ATCC 23877]
MTAPTLDELAPAGHDPVADPYAVLAALRAEGAVHRIRVPGSGEAWLVVTRDAARAALTDPRLRNDIRHSASWRTDGGHAIGRNMVQSDPPQHTRLRRLVAGHFTPGRIAALRPRVERVAEELLDALPRRGTADLVGRYALPLPVTVICDLLGVPEADREGFHTWSGELVAPTSAEAASTASEALTGYLTELTGRKRRAPDDTLLGELVVAADSGVLTAEELLGMVFLILVAGHETTVDLISATVHSLLTHPGLLDLLRADPGLTGSAVEESLRFNSPVHSTAFRYAAAPLELAGTRIAAGDSVLVSLAAASRDPGHFPDPDRFDIGRRTAGHLGFGHGLHHCLGAPAARLEAAVAVRLLLRRHPSLSLAADPATLTWRTGTLLRGLTELPVRLG